MNLCCDFACNNNNNNCNELPAVRRVDGVCVCAKEDETRFDCTRSFDMYFERSLSLVVEVTVREEE